MLKNTRDSFGSVARTLHWLIALSIISLLTIGFIMADMESSPTRMALYSLHKSTGFFILLLVIFRLVWRMVNVTPQLPASLTPGHRWLSRLSPFVLYALMFIMPLSGIVMSQTGGHSINVYSLFTLPTIFPKDPNLSKIAAKVHEYGAFTFIGVLILHVGAAFYHHFVLKTNILKRMLPNRFKRI